jgi:hypothetical protein
MKKVLLFFLLITTICSAQDSTKVNKTQKPINLVIKTDLLLPVVYYIVNGGNGKAISFTIEKLLVKRHSVQLYSLFFTGTSKNVNSFQSITSTDQGYQLSAHYKFFVSKKRPHSGYYVGAFGMYGTLHSTQQYTLYQKNNPSFSHSDEYIDYFMGCGLVNGVQFYICNQLVIDCILGFGVQESLGTKVIQGDIGGNRDPSGYITAAINIGYKF